MQIQETNTVTKKEAQKRLFTAIQSYMTDSTREKYLSKIGMSQEELLKRIKGVMC